MVRMTEAEVAAHNIRLHAKKLSPAQTVTLEECAELENERELQDQVASYLRFKQIPFVRSRTDKRTTNQVGTSDFICCVNGRFLALEAKMPGKRPTAEQEAFLEAVRLAGGHACVVHSLGKAVEALKLIS